jgi:triacylglycerol lipase
MALNLNDALSAGQFVQAAYAPGAAGPGGQITYSLPLGYQVVQVIYGNDLATDIGRIKSIVPFGFIAQSPAPGTDFIVAIRGTDSIWEWVQDARFVRIACPIAAGAGETDDGFTDVYMSLCAGAAAGPRLVDALRTLLAATPGATLTVTGHSLGSSLATLLALDVVENSAFATPTVITFASPLVGDAQFARTYDAQVPITWRITNAVDLVPKLPPANWGFVHVNQLYPVSSLGQTRLLPSCTHAMTTYMYLVDQANGGAGGFSIDAGCVGLF